ncbi:MAG TPA: zf-HC2 domain-containing protein [Candidatus Polarisedimenticolia bacterium]|nr:zf-HC2 domain-containing protein [Candidatus Polarisedimenticolia bacterium]
MTHEEAVGLLTDFVTGRLNGAQQRALQEHFQSCEECRGLVDTVRLLRGPLGGDEPERGPAGHPTSAGLVGFALSRHELGAETQQELAAHLAGCTACSRIVTLVGETTHTAERDEEERPAGDVWGPRAALAMAAVATAGMAWLGLYRVPQLKMQVAALESSRGREGPAGLDARPSSEAPDVLRGGTLREFGSSGEPLTGPSGPIHVQSLPAPRRGGGEPLAQVTLTGDDRTLYLSLGLPDLPGSGDRTWRFDVIGAGGESLWSRTSTADELHRLMGGSAELVLAVPAADLPAGRHALRLEGADQGGPPFIEIPFLVRRLPALHPGRN